MPRGRDNKRGFRPGPPRGRGRGGRGRGSRGGFRGSNNKRPQDGDGTVVFNGDFEDFTLDQFSHPSIDGNESPISVRGRGGGYRASFRSNSRGRFQPPRGVFLGKKVMRGLGFSKNISVSRIPLSTLERDRPLLKPVVFVRGQNQRTLFEEVEDIIQAHVKQDEPLEDHAPSADIIEKIFHPEAPTPEDSQSTDTDTASESDEVKDEGSIVALTEIVEDSVPAFIIDTTPSPVVFAPSGSKGAVDTTAVGTVPLGDAPDEEVIVYVAPHPRISWSNDNPTPALPPLVSTPEQPRPSTTQVPFTPPPQTAIDLISMTFASTLDAEVILSKHIHTRKILGLKPTPRSRKMAKKERAVARRRQERSLMFSFGLSMEERAALQEGPAQLRVDLRRAQRRRGDSDVEWGTENEDKGGAVGEVDIEEVSNGIGDMDLDGDIGPVDPAAMARFANGVEGLGVREVVTIADLEDEARIRDEDEDEEDGHSSQGGFSRESEEENVFDAEERRKLGEHSDERPDSSDSSEEDDTPRRSFYGRLERLREKGKAKAAGKANTLSQGDEDSPGLGILPPGSSWADRDEIYLGAIDDILEEDEGPPRRGSRKERNKLFKSIQTGCFEDSYDSEDISPNMRKKDRHVPPELQDQWQRDRKKKGDRKRERALARMHEAVEDLSTHKSNRKKHKLLGGARHEGDTFYAERVADLSLLCDLIRAFIGNLELKNMVLPPKSKDWRRKAHLLAEAFNLKSKSLGKGDGRYTTLIKTTRSGVGINENKISRIVSGNSNEKAHTAARAGRAVHVHVRHRDGDEVGKTAPRLSDSNVGFKLLQQMGWAEGERIGVTGGLADPLTAIIKTTKLGLGATR